MTDKIDRDNPPNAPRQTATGSFAKFREIAGAVTRVGTGLGEKTGAKCEKCGQKTGRSTIDFPWWFKPTGLRSFTVDTGFGLVRCTTPDEDCNERRNAAIEAVEEARLALEEAKAGTDASKTDALSAALKTAEDRSGEELLLVILRTIRSIPPDWPVENDAPALKVKANGTDLVPAVEVALGDAPRRKGLKLGLETAQRLREYVSLLPSGLPAQILASTQAYMTVPPVQRDEERVGPS